MNENVGTLDQPSVTVTEDDEPFAPNDRIGVSAGPSFTAPVAESNLEPCLGHTNSLLAGSNSIIPPLCVHLAEKATNDVSPVRRIKIFPAVESTIDEPPILLSGLLSSIVIVTSSDGLPNAAPVPVNVRTIPPANNADLTKNSRRSPQVEISLQFFTMLFLLVFDADNKVKVREYNNICPIARISISIRQDRRSTCIGSFRLQRPLK